MRRLHGLEAEHGLVRLDIAGNEDGGSGGRSEQPVVQRAPFDIGGDRRSRDYERDDHERAPAAVRRGRFDFRRGPGLDLGSSKR